MKLGAQFYSIRNECDTPERLGNAFRKVKEIGYDIVQISGVCDIEAELLKSYSEECSLPITCTHKSFDSIVNDTDELIRYHKIINCPVIGLGGMPQQYTESVETVREFIKTIDKPMKKILDAGFTFAYHNHDFEFKDLGGVKIYEVLLEEAPELHFIHDVYWSRYAGEDPAKYITILGESKRMTNIHFKDMESEPKGPICACGEGVIDFAPLTALCEKYGIYNVLVEQDNAPNKGDSLAQMKISYEHLAPIFGK